MGLLETMRMQIGLEPAEGPDRSPKRYAPYPVWRSARSAAILAALLYVGAIGGAILAGSAWPLVFLLPAILLAPPLPGAIDGQFSAVTADVIAGALGSTYCPSCGQSIFDVSPPSGYFADTNRFRWWPNRNCANCGHDLRKRTADD